MSCSPGLEIQVFVSSLMWVLELIRSSARAADTLTTEPCLQPRVPTDNYHSSLYQLCCPGLSSFKIRFISLGALVMARQVKNGNGACYQADNLHSVPGPHTEWSGASYLLQVVIWLPLARHGMCALLLSNVTVTTELNPSCLRSLKVF